MNIEEPLLRRMWPQGDRRVAGLIAGTAASESVFARFGITTPTLAAHVMAQLSHECGAGQEVVENLDYTAARMMQVWPSRFPTPASAAPYAHNPRALANKVYNGRMGNRAGSDDGWSYRGRGAAQTTGRESYARLAALTGLDLVNDPELLLDPRYFLLCGVAGGRAGADRGGRGALVRGGSRRSGGPAHRDRRDPGDDPGRACRQRPGAALVAAVLRFRADRRMRRAVGGAGA